LAIGAVREMWVVFCRAVAGRAERSIEPLMEVEELG
jgi:hypothetical protein